MHFIKRPTAKIISNLSTKVNCRSSSKIHTRTFSFSSIYWLTNSVDLFYKFISGSDTCLLPTNFHTQRALFPASFKIERSLSAVLPEIKLYSLKAQLIWEVNIQRNYTFLTRRPFDFLWVFQQREQKGKHGRREGLWAKLN